MSELMELREGDEHIAPYLNPTYWDQHELGAGQAMRIDSHLLAGSDPVKSVLADYLNHPGQRFPLRTLPEGEVFDPNDYDHGAVVAMRYEKLSARGRKSRRPQISYEGTAVPLRNTSLPRSRNFAGHYLWIEDASQRIQYHSAAQWGVIVHGKKAGKAALVTVMPGAVHYSPPNSYVDSPFTYRQRPFEIGAVLHSRRSDYESIERFNTLELCSSGLPQLERQILPNWLGRLAFGQGSA